MRLFGLLLLGLLGRTLALGTPGGSLGQRPLGRGGDRLLGRGRGPRLGWLARLHTFLHDPRRREVKTPAGRNRARLQRSRARSLFTRVILSAKSATFRGHALFARMIPLPDAA